MARHAAGGRRVGLGLVALFSLGLVAFEGCEQGDGDCEVVDDGTPCTIDRCGGVHDKLPAGSLCSVQGRSGKCSSAGACEIVCSAYKDCDDGDPCTTDACDALTHLCKHSAAGLPPDDGNPCTFAGCYDGEPKHLPVGSGTPCNALGKCAGGLCDHCTSDAQCGKSTACLVYRCEDGACVKEVAPKDLVIGTQVERDCRELRCDGEGGVMTVADLGDPPADDGNPCTDETCDGWTPVHRQVVPETPCGGGKYCDAVGKCVECVIDGHCDPASGGYCFSGSCHGCKDKIQNGDEVGVDCGGERCLPCNGTACSADATCASGYCVDAVCCDQACVATCTGCNAQGMCLPLPLYATDVGCSGPNACNGNGQCKTMNGYPCAINLQCLSNNCLSGKCMP